MSGPTTAPSTRHLGEVPDDTWTSSDWWALRAFQDRILNEVLRERDAQDAKFGQQNHPDGTSGHNFRQHADAARRSCQDAARGGFLTWFHVAREEFWEAMAETDEDKLRAELVQNAAVFLAWIECIDRRKAARS